MPLPNKTLDLEPFSLASAAANLLNCNVTSLSGPVGFTPTQPYILITRIIAVNIDTANHVVSLFKGATGGSAAGTEFCGSKIPVPANSAITLMYGKQVFSAADFLTGFADVANKVTLNIDAEIGFS